MLDSLSEESEEFMERFVTESDYVYVKNGVEQVMGTDDVFGGFSSRYALQ